MKKTLLKPLSTIGLVLAMLIGPLHGKAQNVYFDNNPVWKVHSVCADPAPCIETRDYNYYVNGDTLIGTHVYAKLFLKGYTVYDWFSSPPVPAGCQGTTTQHDTINPLAYMRDTLNRMYLMYPGAPELLLYDFNLSVGDTLAVTANNPFADITVDSIDSILVGSSQRKRFALSSNSAVPYLLEGIGHEGGLLEPFPPIFDCGFTLECYGVNNMAYYPTQGPTCEMNVGVAELSGKQDGISIAPVPAGNRITVSVTNTSATGTIQLVDLAGRLLFETAMDPSGVTEIALGQIAPGAGFCLVKPEQGNPVSLKWIRADY